MATVQLIAVTSRVATVQVNNEAPIEMTWGLLCEAQEQDGAIGYVYRWLMREFCRCAYDQERGQAWQSPRREVDEIINSQRASEIHEAAEIEAARRERRERQEAEDRRRAREREVRRVEAERRETEADDPWWPIPPWEVPARVRFDTQQIHQGQIVEVNYGTFGRYEACCLDPYKRVEDHSDGSVQIYQRRDV